MAGAESLAWQRRLPGRALRRLGWFAAAGGLVVAISWLLFGAEPERLPQGGVNPIALVPLGATGLITIIAIPFLLPVIRRPLVVADHYALRIRPGALRTLLLPWAEVAEVAGVTVRGEPVLLVGGDPARGGLGRLGDRPRWCDRAVLRATGAAAAGYDLAVRMDEFTGPPVARLAALTEWAPGRVRIVNQLG